MVCSVVLQCCCSNNTLVEFSIVFARKKSREGLICYSCFDYLTFQLSQVKCQVVLFLTFVVFKKGRRSFWFINLSLGFSPFCTQQMMPLTVATFSEVESGLQREILLEWSEFCKYDRGMLPWSIYSAWRAASSATANLELKMNGHINLSFLRQFCIS